MLIQLTNLTSTLISAPNCDFIFTSGYSPIPGSLDNSDWTWNITDCTQPLTYINWFIGSSYSEPNNMSGKQFHLALQTGTDYHWTDVDYEYDSGTSIRCYLCERENQ